MISVAIQSKNCSGTPVLSRLSFEVSAGETLAVLGPSGIGKSTLAWIAAGLDDAFEGKVTSSDKRAMVFQEPTLLPWRSSLDNLTLATGQPEYICRETLVKVGLQDKADLFPGQLSLGQQRRLSLARALVTEPDVLILDEPFASLDGTTKTEMIALTKAVIAHRPMAVMLITHSPEEALDLADRAVVLSGTPAQIGLELSLSGMGTDEIRETLDAGLAAVDRRIDAYRAQSKTKIKGAFSC